MREWYRDIMVCLAVLFGAVQAYFAARGPLPSDPPAIQTATSHPISGLIVFAVLFLIAGLLNSAPLLARLLPKKTTPQVPDDFLKYIEPNPVPPPPGLPAPAEHNSNWLGQMITEDSQRLQQRVLAVKWEPRRAFEKTDPYIDFVVTFVNATVFAFDKPEKIQGKAKFGNDPLSSPPQFEKVLPLTSRERAMIVIRQFVTPEMVQRMKNAINSDQSTMLDFSEVKILLNGHCDGIANANFDWTGPNNVSFKDISTL